MERFMTAFSQQTPLQRAQSHIDMIKKSSILMKRNPSLPLDKPDDRAWEPDAETTEAKRKAIENCELAAEDYANNGHQDMAELYRLKAAMIDGSASATREYFRKLDEVRGQKKGATGGAQSSKSNGLGCGSVLFILALVAGGILVFNPDARQKVFEFVTSQWARMSGEQGLLSDNSKQCILSVQVHSADVGLTVRVGSIYGGPFGKDLESGTLVQAGSMRTYVVPVAESIQIWFQMWVRGYDTYQNLRQNFDPNQYVTITIGNGIQVAQWLPIGNTRQERGNEYALDGNMFFRPIDYLQNGARTTQAPVNQTHQNLQSSVQRQEQQAVRLQEKQEAELREKQEAELREKQQLDTPRAFVTHGKWENKSRDYVGGDYEDRLQHITEMAVHLVIDRRSGFNTGDRVRFRLTCRGQTLYDNTYTFDAAGATKVWTRVGDYLLKDHAFDLNAEQPYQHEFTAYYNGTLIDTVNFLYR
jgi:hypothetical protein